MRARLLSHLIFGATLVGLLALAVAHPSLSIQSARFLTDPVIGCIWVWAAVLHVEAVQLAAAYKRCRPPPGVLLVNGADCLLDAAHNAYPSDTGRWRVAEVF
jgi:hypothetical protein